MLNDWVPILVAMASSSVLSGIVSMWATRKKSGADAAETLVQTALNLESITLTRYKETEAALNAAQQYIRLAQAQLHQYAEYIEKLQDLLEDAGIPYPRLDLDVIKYSPFAADTGRTG